MKLGKLKAEFISMDKRFNSSYFLNSDAINSRVIEINQDKCLPLGELANVFNPPIFKRQFCQNSERAVPYCQSSDVTNALEGSDVYINKQQAIKVGSIVKKNQILITGFGTIGNTRLVNELSEGISYANNVCRVECYDDVKFGYIYAFLSSKYGVSQINKNASGSVVRYIEAPGIKKTLVPILPIDKQKQVHDLILEASSLRVEANKLLQESVSYFNKYDINYNYGALNSEKIRIKKISSGFKRFDSLYNIVSQKVDDCIQISDLACVTIKSQTEKIFIGPRSKRNYIDAGVPFLSTSAMQKANPTKTNKFISQTLANDFRVNEGWLLTCRSGTLGDSIYVLPSFSDYAISEDAIRIIIKENSIISKEYIYAFLKSRIGSNSLLSGSFGSVIQHLNEEYVGDIKIPVLQANNIRKINEMMIKHLESSNMAIIKENQAIDIIEKEIESWQE